MAVELVDEGCAVVTALGTKSPLVAAGAFLRSLDRSSRLRTSIPEPPLSSMPGSAAARQAAIMPAEDAPTAFPASSTTPHASKFCLRWWNQRRTCNTRLRDKDGPEITRAPARRS